MVSAWAGPHHPPRSAAILAPPRSRVVAPGWSGPAAPARGNMADTEPGLLRPGHYASVPAGSRELRGEGRTVGLAAPCLCLVRAAPCSDSAAPVRCRSAVAAVGHTRDCRGRSSLRALWCAGSSEKLPQCVRESRASSSRELVCFLSPGKAVPGA